MTSAYQRHCDERAKIVVTHWSDIPLLPWEGNAASDVPLSMAVDRYAADKNDRVKCLCSDLVCWYMCGEEPTDTNPGYCDENGQVEFTLARKEG